jgi:hypothetical protein
MPSHRDPRRRACKLRRIDEIHALGQANGKSTVEGIASARSLHHGPGSDRSNTGNNAGT